jgi:hypothetical protein
MRTRVGNLIKVENPHKNKSVKHEYRAAILKENNKALPYVFTETELEVAYSRYNKFMDTILEQSLISKIVD